MSACLVLNSKYQPYRIIGWERAVTMLLDGRANLVAEYADRVVRSPSVQIPWPAVVSLKRWVDLRGRVRFNRRNVLSRDGYRCLYCGSRPLRTDGRVDTGELTLDHVVPRAQSRQGKVTLPWSGRVVPVTCWENVVTACVRCNGDKADRTPEQARMRLLQRPHVPSQVDAFWMGLRPSHIPDEWKEYLPIEELRGWPGYWDVELDQE